MADFTNSNWSEADSSNTQPSPNGFPAGILPSEVGGAVRAIMGASKRSFDRSNAMVSSTGANSAYVLTYAVGPTAYVKGEVFRFFANVTNTGAATININGLGVRNILRADGNSPLPGEIVGGQVITLVYDGASFLAQNITTKNLKESVSISKDSDAVLTLEDTSAPTNTFRRKGILSSKNVGGGNDWLFRQTRPSDGATEDFTLKTGTGGTIWTTGNFNPDLKANLSGAIFTGDVTTYRPASPTTGVLYLGNQANRYIYYDGVNYTMPGANLYVNGSQVWKRDDFDPATKASLNAQVRFNGVFPGPSEAYFYSDGGTNNVRFRAGAGPNYKYVGLNDDGTLQVFQGGVEAAGDLHATGAVRANGRVIVGEGGNASFIEMRDTDEGTRFLHNNSNLIGFLGKAGDWIFRADDNGAIWTKQFGDLNTRIEDRGAAYRDSANANTANNYFNKATGARQDINNIPSFNASAIDIVRGGVMRARWTVDGGGTTILQNGDNGDNFFYVQSNGQVWTKQLGDLNTRIEDRAYAHASGQAGTRVAKTGDTMTGDLQIQKAYPNVRLHYPGVKIWDLHVRENGYLYFAQDGMQRFDVYMSPDGNLAGTAYGGGWITDHIERRASAYANGRQANLGFTPVRQSGGAYQQGNTVYLGWDGSALRAQVDSSDLERIVTRSWLNPLKDIRMTYAGDLNSNWNRDVGNFGEPYGGAVLTTLNWYSSGGIGDHVGGARWRYIQKQDSYGNWYTVGYA